MVQLIVVQKTLKMQARLEACTIPSLTSPTPFAAAGGEAVGEAVAEAVTLTLFDPLPMAVAVSTCWTGVTIVVAVFFP